MKKILLIDDDPGILYTTKLALESEGFCVYVASSSEEGLKKFREEKPDLLLLDLMLPGKSGFQIAKEIKLDKENKDTPIIILSGMSDDASKYMAAKADAVYFIEKPIDIDKLKFYIEDVLKKE